MGLEMWELSRRFEEIMEECRTGQKKSRWLSCVAYGAYVGVLVSFVLGAEVFALALFFPALVLHFAMVSRLTHLDRRYRRAERGYVSTATLAQGIEPSTLRAKDGDANENENGEEKGEKECSDLPNQ
ncbi:MAG: hypothetical protein DRJ03_01990 [Chloroflexi bacterium]|nr:MAG: hypothetical protein DRJ03_01990 [Chloroflexota bacterium]